MGFLSWLLKGRGHDVDELARRLGIEPIREKRVRRREARPEGVQETGLRGFQPRYREFTIPKRSGGTRRILAPADDLKSLQRTILRRLLGRLRAHPAAMGFERGRSIVTNARAHQGQAVVLRFDLVDFFPSTRAKRLRAYFRRIGWNRPATKLLLRLCTYEGGLPQGAPTSPRLSNLVNYRLDARLSGMARRLGAVYTRYADDITISFAADDRAKVHYIQGFLRRVVSEEGYKVHHRKKLSIRRRHQRQVVTGLVVNASVSLPRPLRRWLRAVEHRYRVQERGLAGYQPFSGPSPKKPTLSASQLQGWQALRAMVAKEPP